MHIRLGQVLQELRCDLQVGVYGLLGRACSSLPCNMAAARVLPLPARVTDVMREASIDLEKKRMSCLGLQAEEPQTAIPSP